MPRVPKELSFEARIRAEHPEADALAWARIFTTRKQTFFHSKDHKALHSEPLIFAGLMLAHIYAKNVEAELDMTVEEQKVWRRAFKEKAENPARRSAS